MTIRQWERDRLDVDLDEKAKEVSSVDKKSKEFFNVDEKGKEVYHANKKKEV